MFISFKALGITVIATNPLIGEETKVQASKGQSPEQSEGTASHLAHLLLPAQTFALFHSCAKLILAFSGMFPLFIAF